MGGGHLCFETARRKTMMRRLRSGRRHFVVNILIGSVVASSGCEERNRSREPEDTPQSSSARQWLGLWQGPEGTSLKLDEMNGRFSITIRNLDGPRRFDAKFDGKDGKGSLTFERDGVLETIRAGSGKDTGMKWFADKSDCLVVKFGEGYCRG